MLSKQKFKLLVKKACKTYYHKQISEDKKHLSKGNEIFYSCLELQPYLRAKSNLSLETMKRILKIRLRDIPLKRNFPNLYEDKKCLAAPVCVGEDSNQHVFSCLFLEEKNQISTNDIEYKQIFGDNIMKQEKVANIMFVKLQIRSKLLPSPTRGSHDPRNRRLGIRGTRKITKTVAKRVPKVRKK